LTQIKKFAWSGTAVALAAILAMAVMANTAYAAISSIDIDGDGATSTQAIGTVFPIEVTATANSYVQVAIDPASTGTIQFLNGSILQADGGGIAMFDVRAATAGQVILRFTDLSVGGATAVGVVTIPAAVIPPTAQPATQLRVIVPDASLVVAAGAGTGVSFTVRVADGTGAVGTGTVANLILTTTRGQIDTVATCDNVAAGSHVLTNVSGNNTFYFCASATAGVATISAIDAAPSNALTSGTGSITVAAPATNVDIVMSNALGTSTQITATATVSAQDTNGNPAQGTASISASPNTLCVIAGPTNKALVSGSATFTVVSLGTAGNCVVIATVGAATETIVVSITASPSAPPVAGDATFTGTIAPSGVSLVTFGGGTLAEFAAAGTATGAVSVWTTVGGSFIGWIPGAPAVVNAAFFAQFADGVPAGTIVIIVK
jgi:hypothetical protein